jgi:hypothetical protein
VPCWARSIPQWCSGGRACAQKVIRSTAQADGSVLRSGVG